MHPMFKYLVTRLIISFVSTALIYIFYPLITGHQNLTNIGSVFLITTFCSFFVHLIYLTIFKLILPRTREWFLLKVLVCFTIIPAVFVAIGLFTYGVDYKGLLLSAIAIGLPNAALPYLEKRLGSNP